MRGNIWHRSYNKYSAEKVEYHGEKFDSKAEFHYYLLLADRQKKGEIRDLQRQVTFELQPPFRDSKGRAIRAIKYIADFVYYDVDTGERHIIDVKGIRTDAYKIKAKMMAYQGNEIEEVRL